MVLSAAVYGWLRGLVQMAWGAAAARFGILDMVPEAVRGEFLDWLVIAAVGGAALALIRWLETRSGTGILAVLARKVGALLMLGLSGKQPVYTATPLPGAKPLAVGFDNGGTTPALK